MKDYLAEINWYLSNFKLIEANLNRQIPLNHHEVRRNAINQFAEIGFPTLRDEAWRFTNISAIARNRFKMVTTTEANAGWQDLLKNEVLAEFSGPRLIFVNGNYIPSLSNAQKTEEFYLAPLSEAAHECPDLVRQHVAQYIRLEDHAFTALNTAFFWDGGFVHIPTGKVLAEPIHLVFLSDPHEEALVSHPRNLIVLEKNSQATVIESFLSIGSGRYFTNTATELVLAENAILDHIKLQNESEQAYHIAVQQSHQKHHSNLCSQSFSFGGTIVRNDVNAIIDGEGVETTLNGLYVQEGDQHVDNHTLIEHAQPNSFSRELYKGILKDHSRAVFNGRIHVRQAAQKTDAIQSNQNLLLTENARVNTQPQLEIYADDVRCTHGGTVGQLDENGMFYLRTRGVDRAKAHNIMVYAFASDVTDRIKVEAIRNWIDELVLKRLNANDLLA